jgi:H/ACA ribonucleoprotein complex subunit 2
LQQIQTKKIIKSNLNKVELIEKKKIDSPNKMGKDKKEKKVKEEKIEVDNEDVKEEADDYDDKLRFVNQIANPIANKKLAKRLFKMIKKGTF